MTNPAIFDAEPGMAVDDSLVVDAPNEKVDSQGAVAVAPPAPALVELSKFAYIKQFHVFSATGGTHVYANGYQQLKLVVAIEVCDLSGQPMKLTEAEQTSIVLTDSASGEQLPWDTVHYPDQEAWKYTFEEDKRFYPIPHSGPVPDPIEHGPDVCIKTFYVSTNAHNPMGIRPCITRSDKEVFYPEKSAKYGSITLTPVPSPAYRPGQYQLREVHDTFYTSRHIAKVVPYVIRLIVDQQAINFVSCTMDRPLQMLSTDDHYLGYYAVAYFNGRQVANAMLEFEAPDSAGANDESGAVTVVMVYGAKGGDVQVRSNHRSGKLWARDMYGNLHDISLNIVEGPVRLFIS